MRHNTDRIIFIALLVVLSIAAVITMYINEWSNREINNALRISDKATTTRKVLDAWVAMRHHADKDREDGLTREADVIEKVLTEEMKLADSITEPEALAKALQERRKTYPPIEGGYGYE